MFSRALLSVTALSVVGVLAGGLLGGCADPGPAGSAPEQTVVTATAEPDATEFSLPPPSDVLRRALRTDLCALLDEAGVAELGWQRGTAVAETLTSCAAASADLKQSVNLSIDTAVSEPDTPADGDRCLRMKIVDQQTLLALTVLLRGSADPCVTAARFVATAAQRFGDGAGVVEPPNPWIALDACELLPRLLPAAEARLGGPKPTLREVRRLGPRGCIATHQRGEVTLSVSPAAGKADDLDGDLVAVAARPARLREFETMCVLRLVGQQMGGEPRFATQVITIEVASELLAAADRCTTATELGEAVAGSL